MNKINATTYAQLLYQIGQSPDQFVINQKLKFFVSLLAQRGQLSLIRRVIKKYNQIYNQKNKITTVKVETPYELDEAVKNQITLLAQSLRKTKNIELTTIVNTQLIGGAKIIIDDLLIDTSLRHQLDNIKKIIK